MKSFVKNVLVHSWHLGQDGGTSPKNMFRGKKKKFSWLPLQVFWYCQEVPCWLFHSETISDQNVNLEKKVIINTESPQIINTVKCQVLHLGRNNPRHHYRPGGQQSGKQLCREGHRDPGGQQAEDEPAMFPCSKEGQWHPGLHLGRLLLACQEKWSFRSAQCN